MFKRPTTPLSLLLTLLAVLACCLGGSAEAESEAVRNLVATVYTAPSPADERVCPAPDHDHCHPGAAHTARTTAPSPHPAPHALPARVDARPAAHPLSAGSRPAAARAPDLHVLQVLRT